MRPGDGAGEPSVGAEEIGAEDVVRQITVGGVGASRAAQRVVRFTDRHIVGLLDLRAVELPYALEFVGCQFEISPDLRQARLASCEFTSCVLPGLAGRNLHSDLDVRLAECRVTGTVDLRNGDIGGSLDLRRTHLTGGGDNTLLADQLQLADGLIGTDLVAEGAIRLRGLRAGGGVRFDGASLRGVLDLTRARIGGDLQCEATTTGGFRSTARILLPDAEIGGRLSLRGARLARSYDAEVRGQYDDSPESVVADRVRVSGDVDLSEGFISTGTVSMVNARVGASIHVANAKIDLSGGREPFSEWSGTKEPGRYVYRALNLAGTRVDGDIDARDARVAGRVRLTDLTVRGDLRLDRLVLANRRGDAIEGSRVAVGGNLDLRGALVFGSVLLPGVHTGANLDLRASRFVAPAEYRRDMSCKPSVDLEAAYIGQDLVCAGGVSPFVAHGAVRLRRAEVGRLVTFQDAELGARLTVTALDATGMVTQELRVDVATPPRGRVELRHARCATLSDNDKFWNATGPVEFEDFRYEDLAEPIYLDDPAHVTYRLRLLHNALRGEYRAGAYDQLASVLRNDGGEKHAATVQVAKQRHRYEALAASYRMLGPLVLLWSMVQRYMVGYGFRPLRGFLPLVLLVTGIVTVAGTSAAAVRNWLLAVVIALGGLLLSTTAAGLGHRLAGYATTMGLRTVVPEHRTGAPASLAEPSPLLLAGDVDEALQSITVDAYLDTDDPLVARAVCTALDDLVDLLGYERPEREFVQRGSWWRRATAKVKKGLSSDEITELRVKAERTIELIMLEGRQAEVDVKTAEAVARLSASLEQVSQGCLQAGSVLVVKYQGDNGPVLLSRNLSPLELKAMERYPEILHRPRNVLDSLATAITTLDRDDEDVIDPPA